MASLRKFLLLVVLLPFAGTAYAVTDERVKKAQECGMAGDYDCSFSLLIEYFEQTDVRFADEAGYQLLTGAMLESSLVLGYPQWETDRAITSARRFLAVLSSRNQNPALGYASGHGILALSCATAGDEECAQTNISFLCENSDHLALPMNGHSKYREFTNSVTDLLIRECGVPQ